MNSNKARVFISYSHRGDGPEWKAWLLRHLGVFERHHLLDVWQDGRIRVSSYWDDDIKQAMSDARLAVVLLTKEALESEYILNTEFPLLRERQQRDNLPVFPVVCEPCDWKVHEWLRATQAPNESNPLSQLSEAAQDRVFRKLATDIAEELSRVALEQCSSRREEAVSDDSALRTPHSELKTYLDKFPLTRGPGLREERLIGREQELALLDLAFAQPHTAIVSLVAWGGVGKTMLVQHWLQRLQREGWFGARRVYAWSFYSQGTKEDRQASEDTFLAHALDWFGVQCEPTLSPWDKGRLLADAVARERTLLILDGIEPLQYPPGPMGGQLRAPGVQSLLKQLARKAYSQPSAINHPPSAIASGLCLVTTREPLSDLADFQRREGSPWGSVLRVDLGNLTEEAGAALLHHAGANRAGAAEIKPDDKELLAASREVDGHALTLNLLGRFLARAHGGDIRRRDLVKFEEADRKEQGGTTFKMLAAFENWFAKSGEFGARQLAILRILGLFDRPADAGCIGALRKPPVITGLTDPLFTTSLDSGTTGQATVQPLVEEDLNIATSFLADFGLLALQTNDHNSERVFDCHPLIREHFAQQARSKYFQSWQAAHQRLYEHLKGCTDYQPNTLEGLQPLYQAVLHGCEAGRHQEACERVLIRQIQRQTTHFSTAFLGAYGNELQALAGLFSEPWARPVSTLSFDAASWVLHEASSCLVALGRVNDAFRPLRISGALDSAQENWRGVATSMKRLSELSSLVGNLSDARDQAKESVAYAERSEDNWKHVACLSTLGDVLNQMGDDAGAKAQFEEAEQFHLEHQSEYPLLYSRCGFQFCELLLATAHCAAWHERITSSSSALSSHPTALFDACRTVSERATKTLAWAEEHLTPLDVAFDRLTLGRASLLRAQLQGTQLELESARLELAAALNICRASRNQYDLPHFLLSRAWLRSLDGDTAGARTDLDEAWDIAERGPMRLHMADIHLYRARLFFREKPYPWKSPQADLAAAEKLIHECGYHRRDEELADAKRAILGKT